MEKALVVVSRVFSSLKFCRVTTGGSGRISASSKPVRVVRRHLEVVVSPIAVENSDALDPTRKNKRRAASFACDPSVLSDRQTDSQSSNVNEVTYAKPASSGCVLHDHSTGMPVRSSQIQINSLHNK